MTGQFFSHCCCLQSILLQPADFLIARLVNGVIYDCAHPCWPWVYTLSLPGWKVNNELITLPQVQYRTECVQTLLSCASQVKLLIYTPNPFEFVHFCLFLGSCSLMASFSLRKPHFPLPQRVDARDFWYSEKPSHFLRDCSLGFLLS